MAFAKKPTVFVSSTCYDLKQIRDDVYSFITKDLGYDVLLSEKPAFPLDPSQGTVDNCLRAVKERADIFVLVIGCRYGSTTETGRSVTNMEYIAAKAKGIPIYVFIDNKILHILPLWHDNPNGDFSSTVDEPKLFEFVDEVRSKDSVWSFGFEYAQNIIDTLRMQLSYLFFDCMAIRQRFTEKTLSRKALEVDEKAFQIILMKPWGWEHKLFSQVLSCGLNSLVDRRRDFDFGINFSTTQKIETLKDVIDYITTKLDQLLRAVNIINTIIKKVLPEAFGEQGTPGDADFIIYAANRIVDVYNLLIDWSLEFGSVMTEDLYSGLVHSFSNICGGTLRDIERFSRDCCEQLERIPDSATSPLNIDPITITLTLREPDTEEFDREVKLLKVALGLPE